MGPQEAVRQTMEGTHPHRVEGTAERLLKSLTHLARRLVGKGHSHQGVGRQPLFAHQERHTLNKHTRLSRPGAGDHQKICLSRFHRQLLWVIQMHQVILGRGVSTDFKNTGRKLAALDGTPRTKEYLCEIEVREYPAANAAGYLVYARRSKRSASITLFHAETKSATNLS